MEAQQHAGVMLAVDYLQSPGIRQRCSHPWVPISNGVWGPGNLHFPQAGAGLWGLAGHCFPGDRCPLRVGPDCPQVPSPPQPGVKHPTTQSQLCPSVSQGCPGEGGLTCCSLWGGHPTACSGGLAGPYLCLWLTPSCSPAPVHLLQSLLRLVVSLHPWSPGLISPTWALILSPVPK